MRPLGKNQVELLSGFRVSSVLLVLNKEAASLVKRGLLREENGCCCITPSGLRALAFEMDTGRTADALTTFAQEKARAALAKPQEKQP